MMVSAKRSTLTALAFLLLALPVGAQALTCDGVTDATPAIQTLLDSSRDVTLPPQDRECLIRTLRMRTREQTLTAHGVTFRALGAPTDPMLAMTADWTTVRGGIWIGRGGPYLGPDLYDTGLIEVRAAAYAQVTEAALIDAPAVAVSVGDSFNATVSLVLVRAPRGRSILMQRSPWATVSDSIIEAPRHDGISLLLGSTFATVTRNLIDYSATREWSADPLAPWCGYAQGVVAWGDAEQANIAWNVVRGPIGPRPPCHLWIGISLAHGSHGSIARQNVVDGQAGGESGITYCLEIADASGGTLDGNWVSRCRTAGISVVHGDTYSGRPTAGALVRRNLVEQIAGGGPGGHGDGISIGGHVQGARVEGNTVRGARVPINVWPLAGGIPIGVELVGNDTGEKAR